MYYTQADAEKAIKTLWFEGAGWAERGDVSNCRIRTAFKNDKGDRFYLELTGTEVHEKTIERFKVYRNAGFVDYCYQITEDGDKILPDIERKNFEYSMAGILDFVNIELGCSFDAIKIADCFYQYHVHAGKGGYNYMEDHTFDDAHATAARNAFDRVDHKIREQLGEKYSKISLESIEKDHITVRCYASDKSMREHGLNPEHRIFTAEILGARI